MDRSYI